MQLLDVDVKQKNGALLSFLFNALGKYSRKRSPENNNSLLTVGSAQVESLHTGTVYTTLVCSITWTNTFEKNERNIGDPRARSHFQDRTNRVIRGRVFRNARGERGDSLSVRDNLFIKKRYDGWRA